MNQFAYKTAKQLKARINKLIDSIPYNTIEDKNKIYDWKIIKEENKLVKIPEDKIKKI